MMGPEMDDARARRVHAMMAETAKHLPPGSPFTLALYDINEDAYWVLDGTGLAGCPRITAAPAIVPPTSKESA